MAIYSDNYGTFFDKYKHKSQCNMPDEHFHTKHELYFLLDGSTKYFIEDELYFLNPGDIIFIPKGTFHKTSSYAERIILTFDDDYITENYREHIKNISEDKHIIIGSIHRNKIREIFHKMEKEETKKECDYQSMQKLYLQELLIMISRYRIKRTSSGISPSYATIQDIAKYISANYCSDLSLNTLSRQFALSPNYLSKQFKKVTEIGLSDYINITRISAAERLLLNTTLSITDIALMCGFNDSNYFAAVFKKFKGITPKKYSLIHK